MQASLGYQKELSNIQLEVNNYRRKLEELFNKKRIIEDKYVLETYRILEDVDNKISKIRELSLTNSPLIEILQEEFECIRLIIKLSKPLNKLRFTDLASFINIGCYSLIIDFGFLMGDSTTYLTKEDINESLSEAISALELSINSIDFTNIENIDELLKIITSENEYKREKYTNIILDINHLIVKIKNKLSKSSKGLSIDPKIKKDFSKVNELGFKLIEISKALLNSAQKNDQDAIITIPNVSWEKYESITDTIGEASWCKISYLDGLLEIMSPGLNHEIIKEGISLIIQLYCIKKNIDCFAFGSSDLKNKVKGKGKLSRNKQPDAGFCFVNKKQIPDIAIEVNYTSGSIDDLKIYQGIGIPEVWMYDRKNKIKFYSLADNNYQEITQSQYLKDLTPVFLNEIVQVAMTDSINKIASRLDQFS